jgi:hypothetical protein
MIRRAPEETPPLYSLNEEGIRRRNRARSYAMPGVWLALSALDIILFIFLAENNLQRFAVIGLSLVKYVPLIFVTYALARYKAATYLADIYELEDVSIADTFIEEVAFGGGSQEITIHEGKISPEDEGSPIILIGGPGKVQVNLDSVALLERVDGKPEIIEPRNDPWTLGPFERIREIGKFDDIGKREYAIVNLRDQFVRGLTVISRTKDGIPIEAYDIKVMFSILRKPPEKQPKDNPHHYEEEALYSLVYKQAVMIPSSTSKNDSAPPKATGISFPWDTTVIPLVTDELETLIKSHNLSEILASISQREIEDLVQVEQNNTQMRVEMTGEMSSEQTAVRTPRPLALPNFESRSKITAQFFTDDFKARAADLGVAIHWIDIGTWLIPIEVIGEELKNAWKMNRENAGRRADLERAGRRLTMQGLLELVNNVTTSYFGRPWVSSSGKKQTDKEYAEFAKILNEHPELVNNPAWQQRYSSSVSTKKDSISIAVELLKAFRLELNNGRDLIEKENRSSIEKQAEIAPIIKAMEEIEMLIERNTTKGHK